MQFEAEEKLDQAQRYYDHVLKEDETNLVLPQYPLHQKPPSPKEPRLTADGLET
jgi:hypothetical protein